MHSSDPQPAGSSRRGRRSPRRGRLFLIGFLLGLGAFVGWQWWPSEDAEPSAVPTPVAATSSSSTPGASATPRISSLQDVLVEARTALAYLQGNVDDYTARLVKQERVNGKLQPRQEMDVKIQTRRSEEAARPRPMRVYLRFTAPEKVAGREVIWAEDRFEGKLVAHEAGFKGLIPVPPLDPEGMLAMLGNRYPITQIGLINLVRKLIERGEDDLEDSNTSVATTADHLVGDRPCFLIRVIHAEPDGSEDDFSVAEIAIDRERNIPLRYTAFGWPDGDEAGDTPLLESYTYLDVELNVGLSESDFDPENPAYQFP